MAPRCSAKSKQTGERCKQRPVPGGTVCRFHGGAAPQVQAKAEERELERAAGELLAKVIWNPDAAPVTDNVGEMRRLAGAMRQAADVLGVRLNGEVCEHCGRGAEPLDGPTGRAWVNVLREFRQLLEGMERLGLAERQVELQQEQAQLVTSAFLGALAVVSDLLPADRDSMLRAFLSGIGKGPELLEAGGAA
jgi:hypothetical protein